MYCRDLTSWNYESWLISLCKAIIFMSNAGALRLQNRQLEREDGSKVEVGKISWYPQAWDGACEDRQKLMLVFVASNLDCLYFLQKPDYFFAIAKNTPDPVQESEKLSEDLWKMKQLEAPLLFHLSEVMRR